MAGSAIEIVVKMVNEASGGMKSVIGSFTELSSAIGLAEKALGVVKQVYEQSVGAAMDYNLSMVDMARAMGTTTEEASRLTQVADDVRISQEQLSTAMRFAIKNGVQPSIAGISQLADEYNALTDPVARGQFLMENFGKSGLEMGKLLEKGGAGIRNMAASIDAGLIVTERAAAETIRYYNAVDRLNDAWTAYKISAGTNALPTLVRVTETMVAQLDISKAVAEADGFISHGQMQVAASALVAARAYQTFNQEAGGVEGYIKSLYTATSDLSGATGDLAVKNQGLIGQYGKLTEEMIFNQAAANMDSAAAIDLGIKMGLLDPAAVKAEGAIEELAKKQRDGKYSAQQYADAVLALKNSIEGLDGVTAEAYVDVWMRQHGMLPPQLMPGGTPRIGTPGPTTATAMATGVEKFVVPPGFPNDSYPLRVESGEMVTVEPAYGVKTRSTGNGIVGGATYNFNFYSAVSLASKYEAEQVLVPYIKAAMRQL